MHPGVGGCTTPSSVFEKKSCWMLFFFFFPFHGTLKGPEKTLVQFPWDLFCCAVVFPVGD